MLRLLLIPPALVAGALWCWALLRLALVPVEAGAVEEALVMSGWTLSLLPVHCARRTAAPASREPAAPGPPAEGEPVTRASRLPRSGAGSGRS